MLEGPDSCSSVELVGSDADGDEFYFLLEDSPIGGATLNGRTLTYCHPEVGRAVVRIPFDVCDSNNACSFSFSGMSEAVFHVVPKGPSAIAFQLLPSYQTMRVVFDLA